MLPILNQPCALVDLETTGMSTVADRITEVGLLSCAPDAPPQSWEQLVNPGTGIPELISRLTGITPAMVAGQPYFEEIAPALWERLRDRLFVAHNARFDYGFLKAAFRACGYDFRPKIICTLKLSRALFPHWRRHSLDAICESIGYRRGVSHRAMADVQAMFAFLCYAVAHCGEKAVNEAAARQLQKPSLPIHLQQSDLDAIPDTPGVYYFYGEDDRLLYVGKSKTLRTRVQSHFGADYRSGGEMTLSRAVRRIAVTETVGELGALLLENRQIKRLSPIYNRRQRRCRSLWVWQLESGDNGFLKPVLVNKSAAGWRIAGDVYGPYRNKSRARKALEVLIDDHQLCRRALGIEAGNGTCFARQLGHCRGACEGGEGIALHNLRVMQALAPLKLKTWPHAGPVAIREVSDDGTLCCYHLVNHWAYLGAAGDIGELEALLDGAGDALFDIETYRLLLRMIRDARYEVFPLHRSTDVCLADC